MPSRHLRKKKTRHGTPRHLRWTYWHEHLRSRGMLRINGIELAGSPFELVKQNGGERFGIVRLSECGFDAGGGIGAVRVGSDVGGIRVSIDDGEDSEGESGKGEDEEGD
ncbi:hypothetical protein QQ045_029033 [Rhodiola kirilowii]